MLLTSRPSHPSSPSHHFYYLVHPVILSNFLCAGACPPKVRRRRIRYGGQPSNDSIFCLLSSMFRLGPPEADKPVSWGLTNCSTWNISAWQQLSCAARRIRQIAKSYCVSKSRSSCQSCQKDRIQKTEYSSQNKNSL
jgi:hypothetical protein